MLCCTQPKMNNLFWPDENIIEHFLLPTLFNVVNNTEQVVEPELACNQVPVTMLNNIVDNLEQCGQQNIVQCCFHQARTGCSFFAVLFVKSCCPIVFKFSLEQVLLTPKFSQHTNSHWHIIHGHSPDVKKEITSNFTYKTNLDLTDLHKIEK